MTASPSQSQQAHISLKKAIARLRHQPQKVVGVGAIALILLIGLPVAKVRLTDSDVSVTAASSTVLTVETLVAEGVSSYDVSRTYTGEVAALRASDLGFERGGQLVTMLVQAGDRVAAGTPLARLDTSNLQAQRQQLEAEKARALAQLAELEAGPRSEDIAAAAAAVRQIEQQLALQRTQRSRREFLYQKGAISQEELDEFTYGQRSLQAQLDQARSSLAELRNGTRQEQILAQQAVVRQLEAAIADLDATLNKSTLRSPFAGIIATRQVDEGTVVSAGQAVVRLVENVAPEARIGMPVETASQLQVGDAYTLSLEGDRYPAAVTAVLPEVDPETRTQVVVLQLDQAAVPRISPGQTVRVEIAETIPTAGIWLPITALTQDIRGLWSTYGLMPTEEADLYKVQPQSVEVLHQESDRVLVRGTVAAGDRLVASGVHRLVPGQTVRAR